MSAESPVGLLRQAAAVAHAVGLPAVTAQFLAAEYRALAAGWGPVDGNWAEYSTVVASAREVLALAEQPPGPIGASVYMARGIRPGSWLHEDRFTAFRHAYSYASAKTHAIPGLSKISAEEAYYVWRIIQHGFEFNERTKNDPRLGVGGFGLPQEATDG